MKLKGWVILIFIFIVMVVFGLLMSQNQSDDRVDIVQTTTIKIAVCPTYYDIADSLDKTEYEIIKTKSTSDSLELLAGNQVEVVLSGRPLKPGEGNFKTEFIAKNGYSFISVQEKVVDKDNLNDEIICTDLEKTKVEIELNLKNIYQTKEIADCPNNSIIVTSWDKTDYSKFSIVQLINSDGSRYLLSRTPILYCRDNCLQKIINQIKTVYIRSN